MGGATKAVKATGDVLSGNADWQKATQNWVKGGVHDSFANARSIIDTATGDPMKDAGTLDLMVPEKPPKLPELSDQLGQLAQYRFLEAQRAGKSNVWRIDPNEKLPLGDAVGLKAT